MIRISRNAIARFRKDVSAVSAIEFALICPVFLLFIFGGFEATLSAWYRSVLFESMDRGARYMRDQRMNRDAITAAGLREAICGFAKPAAIVCTADKLKIALYIADDPVASPIVIPKMIENATPSLTARTYVLAVAMEWPFQMPTSNLILPSVGKRAQVAVRTFVTPDERPIEQ
ncbi:TadE/TadG family type IV pilus assembly protein [Methylopila sp. M107]|uniref:TadE/TadG family type IV pilus assembly protein n=1 Tax=Methylopila sp. M107 TaxID=1101190 RepID=UPI000371817D|nr:TadE/TadG family type IV pilus assembly protein [Methylopila sp. M107]